MSHISDAELRRSTRTRHDPQKISKGREAVLARLNKVDVRCNPKLDTSLSQQETDYMSCVATVYLGADEPCYQGRFDSGACVHAEMAALSAAISNERDLSRVTSIEISSPPCKSCAFVLELLGLMDKVLTTRTIYTHFTGSWKWPEDLQNVNDFDHLGWREICDHFAGSGLDAEEIKANMLQVVRTQTSL